MMNPRSVLAGVFIVLATIFASCAGRSSSSAPRGIPVSFTGTQQDPSVPRESEKVRAGLRSGGLSPPVTMREAQQILSHEGRAGNPNYHILDSQGNYLYSVNDH